MELQHNFEDEQTASRDFVQGFNHCSILAELAPDLLEEISPVNNPQNDYYDGFFSARVQYREDLAIRHEIESLKELRTASKLEEIEKNR